MAHDETLMYRFLATDEGYVSWPFGWIGLRTI